MRDEIGIDSTTLEFMYRDISSGAQLLRALSERCSKVAGEVDDRKFDIEDLAPETFERVREVIEFIYEIGHALGFVGRDLDDKSMYLANRHHEAKRLRAG